MTETALQLFARIDQINLLEIASYFDLNILFNLVEVIALNDYLKTIFMDVINVKMEEVRQKSRLLLWIPQHFTRYLNVLSDSSLAHVSLLITLFGDNNIDHTLKYMKYTFTEAEQPTLLYINQFFDKSSKCFKQTDKLYKEIIDECTYRHYINNI